MRVAFALLLLLACSSSPTPPPSRPAPATPHPSPPAPAPVDLFDLHIRWSTAANAADWSALAAFYAPEAAVTPASSGSTLRGRDNIRVLFESFAAGFPDLGARPTHILIAGNRLIAITDNRGTNTVALGGMPATGKPITFLGLSVTEVDDAGLITRQTLYADNLNFMGQLGLWPGAARPIAPPPAEPIIVARAGADQDAERDNAATVRTLAALFGSHDPAALTRLYAHNATLDDLSAASPARNTAAIAQAYAELFTAFPDAAMTDLVLIAAGGYVVATYRLNATHAGPYPRLGARTGTMRQLDLEVAALFYIEGGAIARHTIFVDGMAAAVQLGLFDVPGSAPPADFKPPKG